jgi:hypothetical protein
MAYSNFTFETVKERFNLSFVRDKSLFADIKPVDPADLLRQTLQENVPLALAIHTEKARAEMMVTPILMEVRRQLGGRISLFSGTDFDVDKSQGLYGACDFLICLSPDQLSLTAPLVCVAQARNDNIKDSLPQCIAEMVAAKQLNEKHSTHVDEIFGVVTTGSKWQFLKLTDQKVEFDLCEYYIKQADKIIGIIVSVIETAFQKTPSH